MTPLEILLVDDQEARGALVAESLRAGGVDAMIERVDAEQAFRDALGERSWDAVLAGYDMMTGFGAAQALRVVAEEGRALPFLVLAPSPCPAEALDLLRQGADDVVSPAEAVRLAS
ncbi:MAG: response regulator, partial [Alphaproteobacteria bacterium]|nr:response regulator [Alphaproteobacteria bacterium]